VLLAGAHFAANEYPPSVIMIGQAALIESGKSPAPALHR